jgi:hypothetical protein
MWRPSNATIEEQAMKTCAFLTTDDLEGFVVDDQLAVAPLEALGWRVEHVAWRAAAVDWGRFDVVIVRSPWDYQADPEAFDGVLVRIDRSAAELQNPLPLIRWNMRKSYLRDLDAGGVAIPPTAWGRSPDVGALRKLFRDLDAGEIVIKPVIGANAGDAFRLHRGVTDDVLAGVAAAFVGREYLAQPFLGSVLNEGEYSLIYFDGELSHAILKTPKCGDFRVQEEHGGLITSIVPTAALLEHGARALALLDGAPLYARVDLVRTTGEEFAVMEFELIEPGLYFRMDEGSPARFAQAVDRRFGRGGGQERAS